MADQEKKAKSLETKTRNRAIREKIQQKLIIHLFRFTSQSAKNVFASEKYLIKQLGLENAQTRQPTYRVRQAVKRLESKGLVAWQRKGSGWTVILTEKGEKHSQRLHVAEEIHLQKPKKWDGRWRVVIFDVWERRRNIRNKLRSMPEKAGFLRLQDSVWIYPYDCEELVAFLRADLKLGNGVLYIIAEGIENDAKYRIHFDLP